MSKELEELERGILEFEKELEYDCNNEWLKRVIAGMNKCYQRLEAIENSEPSEALKRFEEMAKCRIEYGEYSMPIKDTNEFRTIKQALLKSQFLEEEYNNLMEDKDNLESELVKLTASKQYLKWEDLPFENMKIKVISVRMDNSTYLLIFSKYENCENVRLQYTNGKECNEFLYLNASDVYAKQLFNDLHLEVINNE